MMKSVLRIAAVAVVLALPVAEALARGGNGGGGGAGSPNGGGGGGDGASSALVALVPDNGRVAVLVPGGPRQPQVVVRRGARTPMSYASCANGMTALGFFECSVR